MELLCISVKLKNLKANHNGSQKFFILFFVVYIRKVKKSESKSQLTMLYDCAAVRCVYP